MIILTFCVLFLVSKSLSFIISMITRPPFTHKELAILYCGIMKILKNEADVEECQPFFTQTHDQAMTYLHGGFGLIN